MKFNQTLLLLVFISFSSIFAQDSGKVNVGFESNSQYYVDDAVTGDFTEEDNFRSNNYLKADYIINKFTFGLQAEGFAPQAILNYSPNLDKDVAVATYFANYKSKKIDATLGYFYEQFGSGLILRSWEDRQLGINNALRGAKISYYPTNKIKITALYGKHRVGFKVSEGEIFGFDTNYDASSENNTLQFGLSYVGRNHNTKDVYLANALTDKRFENLTNAFSGRINYAKNNIYANLEGVWKSKDAVVELGTVYSDKLFYGNALLLEMGYSKKGIGFTTTMRRIENMNFYSDRQTQGNTFNEQIVNFVPALTRQQDYSLANIYVYQAQPKLSFNPLVKAGEIGLQWDLYYKLKKGTKLGGKYGTKIALNFSNWYGLDSDYNRDFKRMHTKFFAFGERYFTDITLEVRKKLNRKNKMIFSYINSYYNKTYVEETHGIIKSNILAVEWSHKFENKKSLRAEAQHLWTKEDKKNWMAATTEFNFNSHVSMFVGDMYNYGNDDTDKQSHSYNVGGSYAKNKTRIALSYSRQRGGLLCVGGVCRVVSPATGFSMSINTAF